MDKGMQTMIDNLHKNTGKTLEEWIALVNRENFAKHGEVISFLKEKHELTTHGYANLVAHGLKGTDAGSVENKDDWLKDNTWERSISNPFTTSCLQSGNLAMTLRWLPRMPM